MKTYTITVSKADIAKAERLIRPGGSPAAVSVCANCPVSQAWGRKFRRHRKAMSTQKDIVFYNAAGHMQTVKLPPSVGVFINAFDSRQPVQPFSFEVAF